MSEIDVSKCEYKGGIECHIRDYPILNCVDVKIEDCHYKQLQQLKQENKSYEYQLEKRIEICDSWMNLSNKYKQCLNEIEEVCKTTICDYPMNKVEEIMKLIKQAKEGK